MIFRMKVVKFLKILDKLLKKYHTIANMREASVQSLAEILPLEVANHLKNILDTSATTTLEK